MADTSSAVIDAVGATWAKGVRPSNTGEISGRQIGLEEVGIDEMGVAKVRPGSGIIPVCTLLKVVLSKL